MNKSVLVTGCPRSGTKYTAHLLQGLGLDVRHEDMGRDGTSNWCMAVSDEQVPWGPRPGDFKFDVVLHQVRNPIDCIPSFSTLTDASWAFICRHIEIPRDEPLLLRCARFWCHWNLKARHMATWQYRIEDLPSCFEEFCKQVGVRPDRRPLERISPNVNTRRFIGLSRSIKWAYAKFNVDPPALVRNHLTCPNAYDRAFRFTWDALKALDTDLHDQVRSLAGAYGYSAYDLDFATCTARGLISADV